METGTLPRSYSVDVAIRVADLAERIPIPQGRSASSDHNEIAGLLAGGRASLADGELALARESFYVGQPNPWLD